MQAVEIIFGILLIVFSLAIVLTVLWQEGSQKNMGVISGGSDTFLSKNKSRSKTAWLAFVTKFVAFGFVICVIAVNIITYFSSK
jgi:protein translocase, SecG subunit